MKAIRTLRSAKCFRLHLRSVPQVLSSADLPAAESSRNPMRNYFPDRCIRRKTSWTEAISTRRSRWTVACRGRTTRRRWRNSAAFWRRRIWRRTDWMRNFRVTWSRRIRWMTTMRICCCWDVGGCRKRWIVVIVACRICPFRNNCWARAGSAGPSRPLFRWSWSLRRSSFACSFDLARGRNCWARCLREWRQAVPRRWRRPSGR